MTRTELQRAEMAITDRHNREQEKLQEIGNVIGAVGAIGSLARGVGALGKGIKSATNNRIVEGTKFGDQFHKHTHYHRH